MKLTDRIIVNGMRVLGPYIRAASGWRRMTGHERLKAAYSAPFVEMASRAQNAVLRMFARR